jgi:hypothetical protein
MKNMIVYDEDNISDIINKINFILKENNKELIDIIRKNGQSLVIKKHLTIHRAELIDSII